MKKTYVLLAGVLMVAFVFGSCDRRKIKRTDTMTSGTAVIMADESYAPIVKEQLAVFTSLNPAAEITPVFLGEQTMFELLLSDSIRMAVAARDLTEQEREVVIANRRTPRSQRIAIDGLAIIVNRDNTDSLMTVDMLRRIMTGQVTSWDEVSGNTRPADSDRNITVVFDKPNSSTVRYIIENVSEGEPLSENLYTAESNLEVIEFVSKTPGALGVIGVNWISNPNDSLNLTFNDRIRVMRLSREEIATLENSYQPVPAFIATRDYPLVRETFAIITDIRGGLPSGFVGFLAGEAGQRIILRAGLVPATAPMRLINVTD